MSTVHKYTIIAKEGDQGIERIYSPSINDAGTVAFGGVMWLGTPNAKSGAFVGNGSSLTNISHGSAYYFQQINNAGQVIGLLDNEIRLFDSNNPGQSKLIAKDGVDYPLGFSHSIGLNNFGESVFFTKSVFFTNSQNSYVFVIASEPPNSSFKESKFDNSGLTFLDDIKLADNGNVLITDAFSTIDLYDNNLKSYKTIASRRGRFSEFGRGAISDDGKVVTFAGTDKDGSGIFAWFNDKTVRIAGISGDGILDPGETYQDKNGNGKFDSGEIDIGFFKTLEVAGGVSFDLKSSDEGIGTVAYIATDTNDKVGLYTSSFKLTDVISSSPKFEIFAPNVVVKEGDEISGLGEIKKLNIYDPINKSGQVAFWADTASGEAIVRAKIPIPPISYPDTTPVNIELAGGQFKDTDNDGDFDGQGTIYIGRTDGIARMLRVENATAEYDDQKLTVKGGTVFSEIGGVTTPLFRGDFEIPFSSATTSSLNDDFKNLGGDFKLAGLDVDFNKLSLNRSGIGLGTSFVLPKDVGNITVDSVALGLDTISIDQSGISLGASGKLSLPNPVKKPFFNLFDVEWSNISLEYDAIEKKFKLQGKLTLDSFIKDPFLKKVTADLSGDNFIQIKDGKADVVGSLIIGTDIKNKKGWGLSEIKLDIDTINQEVKGTTRLTFPFKGKTPDADIGMGFKIPIPPLELNELSAFVNNVNVSIPSYPLVYFQKFGGYVKNFAPSDPDPIEFSGEIGATLGPQINNVPGLGSSALIRLDVDGKISSEQLSATGKGSIIADTIANFQGTHTLNWNKKFYEAKGNFSVIDGLIQTQNSFKADTKFNINMAGMASGNIPNILNIRLIRGKNIASGNFLLDFSNDSNLSNDFAAVWSTFQQNVKGVDIDVTLGLKGFFDGRLEPIFASLPPTNSFIVSPGNPWILLSADWTNSNENVQVRIEKPDGTFVEEADFSANNIAIFESLTDSNTRAVAVINPTPGIWDIEVVDDSNLGDINYSGIRDSDIPEIKIIDPSEDIRGGEVTINYEAFDSDSNAEVKLFYDDDNEGFDGILIADNLIENDGISSFVWNTEGVATGDYFIYGMVIDENNPPVFSYSQGKVRISDENVNYIPVATNDTAETNEDQLLTILPSDLLSNDSDIDGDNLTITEVSNSTNGIVELDADGNVLFTPDSNFNGLASFEYILSDSTDTSSATVEVTVNPVNDLPVAINDTAETNEDQPLTILTSDLLSNDSDIDGDNLTITQVTNSANGTVELSEDGNILFTPDSNFNGLASFEYTVSDETDTTSATVEITVNQNSDRNIIEGTTQRDSLIGTDSNDIITGFQGADRITTGNGEDKLVYNSIVDAGDLITDFDPLNDIIDLQGVLQNIGFNGSNAIDEGYVQLVSYGSRGTSLQIDADGTDGSAIFRPYLFLQGVSATAVNDNPNSLTFS